MAKKLEDLTPEERERKAFDVAVKYLAISPRSKKEVVEKLYSKGFHRNEVDCAIEKCLHYRYIDDENYVRSYVDYYSAKTGKKMIVYKLTTEKGIDGTLATNLVEDLISDDDETEKCVKMARAYATKKRITERKDFQKVGAYLFSKGFEWNIINRALSALEEDKIDE